jgi:hypothetical protein
MMPKTLQAKHIPDLPILEFLFKLRLSGGEYELGVLSTYPIWGDHRLVFAMPAGTPWKVRAAKMNALSRRGLVDEFRNGGFRITDKGIEFLYPGYFEAQYQATVPVLRFIKFGDLIKRLRGAGRNLQADHLRAQAAAANQASGAEWTPDEIYQQLVLDPDAGFSTPAKEVTA